MAVAKVRAETAAAASTPGSETVARVLDEGLAALLGGRAVQVRGCEGDPGGGGEQGSAGEGWVVWGGRDASEELCGRAGEGEGAVR